MIRETFRISSALKDIVGRNLITNDFVAIFELVKNSIDAHATRVEIEFDNDTITIIDDGKGMSSDDIKNKWLFLAYSAKRLHKEDDGLSDNYRNQITVRPGFAGSKGIGRFSCDRLGTALDLYSRPVDGRQVEHLNVDWTTFERDSTREFGTIDVGMSSQAGFPRAVKAQIPERHGTVLVISDLRQPWPHDKIASLRSYLAKLVDPFGVTEDVNIRTHVVHKDWADLEGRVGNNIADVLAEKTTRIEVVIEGGFISSTLYDRGTLIYKTQEESPYDLLCGSRVAASIYYLNRSAKHTFTARMGLQPVQFGNTFLFVNGFRIFPIGEPTDDTFGIARRKQQGTARYFGLRDILGKIDVAAPPEMFQEASSRDAGLIGDERTDQLYDAIRRFVIFRLERYVVAVNWPDSLDLDRDDASGLRSDAGKSRVISVVRALAGSKSVTLLDFNRELIDVISERATRFEETMAGLVAIAEKEGDRELLDRIERSRARYEEMKKAEAEALAAAERETSARIEAERRAGAAERRAEQASELALRLERQNRLLIGAQDQDNEQLMLFHHQSILYATEIASLVRTGLARLATVEPILEELNDGAAKAGIIDLRAAIEDTTAKLQSISLQNARILAVTRFATQANFRLEEADRVTADIVQFLAEYVAEIASTYEEANFVSFDRDGLSMRSTFRPMDISIVVDNLIDNAKKARATQIRFQCRKVKGGKGVEVTVDDDGRGIDEQAIDPARIFDKGYTSSRGSGLGLYHTRQVLEEMGGGLGLDPERRGRQARFIIKLPGEEKAK